MLPLVTPVATPPVSPQPATSPNTQSALLSSQADAAASARQQLSVAVTASGAPAAYNSHITQQRPSPTPARQEPAGRTGLVPQQQQASGLLPDTQLFEARPTAAPATPLPARPLPALTVAEAAPFAAQAAAQAVAAREAEEPQQTQRNLPAQRRLQALAGKKPGIADTSGADAYAIALERNAGMSLNLNSPTIEKFL